MLLPSALHACALLPTSSGRLNGPFAPAFFNVSWAHTPHVYSWLIAENQGVPMLPLDTQITGLAHHCHCRSSYLSRTSRTCFIQDSLFMMPFSGPDSFCPILSAHGGEFTFHFEAVRCHEQGQGGCTLFCPLLLPSVSTIFQPFRGRHLHRMNSPSPCRHHTRS